MKCGENCMPFEHEIYTIIYVQVVPAHLIVYTRAGCYSLEI